MSARRSAYSVGLQLALASSVGAAKAEELHPARDGSLGALLVAAPVAARELSAEELRPALGRSVGAARYSVIAAAAGSPIELTSRVPKGQSALLGASLATRAPLRALFLISSSDGGELYVDGRKLSSVLPTSAAAAWYPAETELERGTRSFALRLTRGDGPLSVRVRVLSAADLRPPPDARFLLPGADVAKEFGPAWLQAEFSAGLTESGYAPLLRLSAPGGAPAAAYPVRVAQGTEASFGLGTFGGSGRGMLSFEAHLPSVSPKQGSVQYRVFVGDEERSSTLALAPEAPALLARGRKAERALRTAPAGFADADVLRATLVVRMRELQEARTQEQVRRALGSLASLLLSLEQRRDPLKTPGVHELARFSEVSTRPDPIRVHVPRALGEGALPLVVLLHGMNGTPKGVMDAFLDDRSEAPRVPAFVIAPHAHGNAFYRGPGEYEVLQGIQWALAVLPVDKNRVSISGVSMGGTGTAHFAVRYPDLVSAAAPLCGYHSYFVRRDTANRPLSAWERSRMAHWSPASWAGAGRDLPWWIAHGKKDFPLENSKVLIAALKEARAKVTEEWPDTGHAVWEKTYAGARLFPWLSRHVRPSQRSRISLVTDSYRYATQRWLGITRLGAPGSMARVQAEVDGHTLRIQTENAGGVAVDRARLGAARIDSVELDGTVFPGGSEDWSFVRSGATWKQGDGRPGAKEKQLGAEGPIRDVFNAPVVFSYGAAEPASARAAREVAEAWAARFGAEAAYPLVPDHALFEDAVRDVNLVIVGTPASHKLLRRYANHFALKFEAGALHVGSSRFDARNIGAAFIAQSPLRKDRSWLLVISRSAAGLHLSRSLPALLPDFVVYDEGIAAAAGQQVFGETRPVAAGFFDHKFRLPASLTPAATTDGGQ